MLSRPSNMMRGSGYGIGSIKDAVVFDTPGGEGDAPEQAVTPTREPNYGDASMNPVTAILLGAAMFVAGFFGLRKLLD